MKLFILRHGEAERLASRDSVRPLTECGITQTREILQRSFADLQAVTRILASPYVRAQQTAALAAELLAIPVQTCEILTPDNGLLPVIDYLQSEPAGNPLLVSHQPLVGTLLDWLTGAARGRYFMGTSALACLETDVLAQSCANLSWLRQPGENLSVS